MKFASLLPKLPVGAPGQLVQLAERLGSRGLQKYSGEIARTLLAQVKDEKRSQVIMNGDAGNVKVSELKGQPKDKAGKPDKDKKGCQDEEASGEV